jgi:chemotaxis protein methyltransferase CheR
MLAMKRPGNESCEEIADGISAKNFARLSRLIHDQCGIKMPPHKKNMLEARLRKRLRSLGLATYGQYCDYLFGPGSAEGELVNFINVVTTNKTDFFREAKHFDFLTEVALPRLLASCGVGLQRPLRVWSAGCSTGEEPYTLAMVLSEFAQAHPGFDFSILATDISTRVLEKARLAIYREERVEPVPQALKKRYLLRSRDPEKGLVRVAPELRSKVQFRRLNFMDETFGLREPVDIIFFRNVMIYFDRNQQMTLLQRLCGCLPAGRYLFTGHSESLHGMGLPVVQVAPAAYRKL